MISTDRVLDERGTSHGADIVHITDGGGFRILFLNSGFKVRLDLLDIILGDILDADVHFVVIPALDGHGAGGDPHAGQDGADIGRGDGRVHIILHGKAALEIDTHVDTVAEDGQHEGDQDDRGGDDQADAGAILNDHYSCTSFSAFTRV